MQANCCLAILLLVAGCGRRNFNVDAGIDAPVDAITCAAPDAGCPNPSVYECGGSCYVWCPDQVSRPTAATTCATWGGCLATITSQSANDCVARDIEKRAWIGALQDNTATDPGDKWRWCDATLITFDRWSSGFPKDYDSVEDTDAQCAVMSPAGDWRDEPCGVVAGFVCVRPL